MVIIMGKLPLQKGSRKNYKRLLHLTLSIIFIITSIWTSVLGETVTEDIGNGTNPKTQITDDYQAKSTEDNTDGISKDGSADNLPDDSESNLEDNSDDNFPDDSQDNRKEQEPGQTEGQNREQSQEQNQDPDQDQNLERPQEQNQDQNPAQEQSPVQSDTQSPAQSPTQLPDRLQAQPQGTIQILSDFGVTNLKAAPNMENNAIILTWDNPVDNEDFYCVVIEKSIDTGEEADWEYIGNTEENSEINTFEDTDVFYYINYKYRVIAVDMDYNIDENPPEVSARLNSPQAILLQSWDLGNNGVINLLNFEYYQVNANIMADNDIVSIEYELSTDNSNWSPIDETIIDYDYGLEFNSRNNSWNHHIYLNFTETEYMNQDSFWIKVTATDIDGTILSDVQEISIDMVCEDATDFTADADAESAEIRLSWSVPDDYMYGILYKGNYSSKYGWQWQYLKNIDTTSYTDTDVDPDNLYKTYKYRILIYDVNGNESQNPPEITVNFDTPGPIGFMRWYLTTEDGKINRNNSSNYSINAYFYSINPINTIKYNYSLDGEIWLDLTPFISSDSGTNFDQKEASGNHYIRINIGDESGIPDGGFHIQAMCTDEEGNTHIEEKMLIKDATLPQNVTNITALPNEDNTAIVLTWTNPASDLEYLIIERDNRSISTSGFNLETFTDSDVKPGMKYTYKFMVYDAFGNCSLNPPTIDAILSTDKPILESMTPEDGYLTKGTTLDYSATFRSDKKINRIIFEASKDGVVWELLKDDVPRLEYNGYYLWGTWDISSIEEEEWNIRATAYAEDGGMASETRRVFIDHKAPPVPSNFRAEVSSNNTISFTWDTVEGAEKYYIRRDYANPEYYGPSQQTIYPPEHSYIWSGLYKERPYIFTLRSVDSVGNTSEAASILIEIHEGPEIILDEGYNVYTNNSGYVLRGTTVPGAIVTVNGEAVLVDEDGKFSYNSVLTVIDNSFTIMSKKDGITHTVKQRVVYDTQVPTINQFSPYYSTYFGPDTARISISTSDNNYIHRQVLQVKRSEELPWEDIIEIPSGQTSVYLDITSNVGDGGPLEDGAYKFRLLVWDRAGNVAGEDLVRIWTIDSTRPEPPTNLTAAEETGKITLSWEASISPDLKTSSQYKLYRSTKTGGNYILIATTSNTRYENTTVSEGVTYYYVVTATDKAGNESEYSNEISASPENDIKPPAFRSLPNDGKKFGGKQARIILEATDDSPQGVEKFIMEYSNDNGASWESLTLGASSKTVSGVKIEYCDYNMSTTGMVSGDYIFRFSAIDYSGNTVTVDRNLVFDLSVAAVQNLTARSGEGSIILEWEVPPDNDINSYDIMRSTYYSGGYNTAKILYGGDIKTYTDTAITLGKRFYYKIVSKDSYYPYPNQSVSEIVSAVASDDITPPQITYISIEDSAYIGGKTISLNVRATDNKKPISAVFFGSQDGGATWEPLNIKWTSSTILPDNVTYSFFYNWTTTGFTSGEILVKIIVKDEAGNEGEAQRTWNLDLDVSPATNLRTTPGDGSILIEWDPVTDEDINSSNAYNILRSESSGGPYSSIKSNLGKTTTQYTDTGVQTGKTYYYVIRSRDNFGNETLSSEIAAMPAGDEIPPVINAVTPDVGATIGGPVSHTLRVDASDNAGMLGATAEIEYSVDGENWTPVNQNIEGPYNLLNNKFYFTARWNLIDLVSGNYKIRYTITDGAGNSSNLVADYYIDRTGPSAPENLLATYGQKAIGLVWEAVPETDAISYYVYRANTLNGEYTRIKIINIIDGEESNIYSDNTVVDGITYFYKVTSVDKFYQEGPASNIASAAAIPDTTPPVVTLIEPDHHSILGLNAQITVTAEDNAALSSITLEYNAGEGWITIGTIATLDVAVFEWSTKGLSGNVQVRAIARDSAGNVSDGSLYRAYTIDNTGPSVTRLKGTAFGGDIVLEWDSVPDRRGLFL